MLQARRFFMLAAPPIGGVLPGGGELMREHGLVQELDVFGEASPVDGLPLVSPIQAAQVGQVPSAMSPYIAADSVPPFHRGTRIPSNAPRSRNTRTWAARRVTIRSSMAVPSGLA